MADSPDLTNDWKIAEAADRLDGMTMKQAFEQFVIGDPEVRALGRKAIESQSISRQLFQSGLETCEYRNFWPVNYEKLDLAAAAVSTLRVSPDDVGRTPTKEVKLAAAALTKRYAALIDPLRNSDVVAIGDRPDGGGSPSSIRKVIWSSPDFFIDLALNSLVRGRPPDRVPFRIGLELQSGTSLQAEDEAQTAEAAPERHKGGRPPEYPWEDAYDRLVIELGEQGHPETGADLARMLLKCFEDMKADPIPSEHDAARWLRTNKPRLWRRVVGGAEP